MKRFDVVLFVLALTLTLFGLFMIYDASSVIAFRDFADKYYYVKEQSLWVVIGIGAMLFFSVFDYHKFYTLALPLLVVALVMLILVFIPGIGIHALGASRWINAGFFTIQPAEFVKLSLAIYLAAWFSVKESGRFTAFLLLLGLVILLIMAQPDMGTASIILFEAMTVYFLSGGSIRHFLYTIPALAAAGMILIMLTPYRAARLASFLSLGDSLENTSYHVKQILIALGSGGLLGVGIGNSLQKHAYLPENVTDSIFAIIAEEVGFFGSLIVISLFALMIYRGLSVAHNAKDMFGRLLAGGVISFLGIQTFINLGAMTALLPLTGVPLPFISYGGSALIVDLAAIGILLNISRQGHHNKV